MDVGSDGVVLACDGAFEVGCFYDVLVHDAARRFAFEKSRGVSIGGAGFWGWVSCSYKEVTEGCASFVRHYGGFREDGLEFFRFVEGGKGVV